MDTFLGNPGCDINAQLQGNENRSKTRYYKTFQLLILIMCGKLCIQEVGAETVTDLQL